MNSPQSRWINFNKAPSGYGLRINDMLGYKYLNGNQKRIGRTRAISNIKSMMLGLSNIQTSILPPHLIVEIWNNEVSTKDRTNFKLIMEVSFDGGTNFYFENKS